MKILTPAAVDWEHPSTVAEGALFLKLLQACRSQLPAPRYMLTTALPVGVYCLRLLDLAACAQQIDALNLMGYDLTGPWTSVAGHHAQLMSPADTIEPALLASCRTGVDFLVKNRFPMEKVLLGVPAYARFFPGATAPGQPFDKEAVGEMDYRDVPAEWKKEAREDSYACAASFVDASQGGKGFVSFDTPRTVAAKAMFVMASGLGGIFFWTGTGDGAGTDSLVASAFEVLKRSQ